ncbi:hypothetical protein HAX54_050991, partial [Datura stramonium]|nr:hypothetical protein [Datura stramonium]
GCNMSIISLKMLKYEYQPKTRLGVKSDGIIEPIQLKHQNNTFGLGYEPTLGRAHNMQFEKKAFVPKQVLTSGLEIVLEPDECIMEGIVNLFIAMAEEDYREEEVDLKMHTIRGIELGDVL